MYERQYIHPCHPVGTVLLTYLCQYTRHQNLVQPVHVLSLYGCTFLGPQGWFTGRKVRLQTLKAAQWLSHHRSMSVHTFINSLKHCLFTWLQRISASLPVNLRCINLLSSMLVDGAIIFVMNDGMIKDVLKIPVFKNMYFTFFSDFKKTFTFFEMTYQKVVSRSLVLNPSKWVHILRSISDHCNSISSQVCWKYVYRNFRLKIPGGYVDL